MGEGQEKTTPYMTARAMICVMALLMLVAANLCFHSRAALAATRIHLARGTLTSTPAAGPVLALLAVSGSGWQGAADGTVVNFGFSINPSCAAASYRPAATEQAGIMSGGAFSGWFLWPTITPDGVYTVCASTGSAIAAAGSYTVLSAAPPRLTISSRTLNVGQQALVSGSNFLPPQTSIMLALQQLSGGTNITLGTVASDANGAFSQTFTIPANPTGPVELIASAGSSTPPTLSASVTFIVYANPRAPTPTPTTTLSPAPTPALGRTPAPHMTVTPTSIPSPQTKVLPASTPTPISLGAQPKAPTPTSSSTPARQQTAKTTATGKEQSGGKETLAVIAGAIFVLLAAALVVLLWRRKARKVATHGSEPATPLHPAFAGSLNFIQSPEMAQPAQPASSWTPGSDWDSLPDIVQQASPSLPAPAANTNGNLSNRLASATSMYRTGEMPSVPAANGVPASEIVAGTPDTLPTAVPAPQSSDLLQDPLLAAIMQQARGGLFVLPGKKP